MASFQEILNNSRKQEEVNLDNAYKALAQQVIDGVISESQANIIADALKASQTSSPETIHTNSENFKASGASA